MNDTVSTIMSLLRKQLDMVTGHSNDLMPVNDKCIFLFRIETLEVSLLT